MNYPPPGFISKPDRLQCLPGRRMNVAFSEPRSCAQRPGRQTSECAAKTPPTQRGRPGVASASHSLGRRGFDGREHVSGNAGGRARPATRELGRRHNGLQHHGPWTAGRPPAKGPRVQVPAAFRPSVPCARTRSRGILVPGAAGGPSSLLCLTLSTVTAAWVACL